MNTGCEQACWNEWDEAALRRIMQQQRKITEASKKLEMKKLYQILIIIDHMADRPQLHKPDGRAASADEPASACGGLGCRACPARQHKLDAVIMAVRGPVTLRHLK